MDKDPPENGTDPTPVVLRTRLQFLGSPGALYHTAEWKGR